MEEEPVQNREDNMKLNRDFKDFLIQEYKNNFHDYDPNDSTLNDLEFELLLEEGEIKKIPKTGPLLLVANRPYPMLNEIIMQYILRKIRTDFNILVLQSKTKTYEKSNYFFLNPNTKIFDLNESPLNILERWIKKGNALCFFPQKKINKIKKLKKKFHDETWTKLVGKIASRTKATVLPVYFRETEKPFTPNSIIDKLKILKEANNPFQIQVVIGSPIIYDHYSIFTKKNVLTEYLWFRTQVLNYKKKISKPGKIMKKKKKERLLSKLKKKGKKIINSIPAKTLLKEISELDPDQKLIETEEFNVYIGYFQQLENIIREIGRLREITFREVGEGTNRELDIDRFDPDYLHLFVWNNNNKEIVGAYRIGKALEIVNKYNRHHLYTNTLFKLKTSFIKKIGPSLEMGRSFVRPEYQNNFTPFLLLWKGIAKYIAQNPKYKILFGPVSISNEYHSLSRHFMVKFLEEHHSILETEHKVKPRVPLKIKFNKKFSKKMFGHFFQFLDDISGIISDIELKDQDLPPLLKQYINLGGRILSFNVDPKFNKSLDGLILVDLTQTNQRLLKFYMGEDYQKFLVYHQMKEFMELEEIIKA